MMEPKKTMVCTCQNCGNEAEMTITCEEVLVGTPASQPTPPAAPAAKQVKRTITCTQCGNEAEMIVDL
ncbi:MAG: hypothetical protein ACUVRZ_07895 [Desulfobacca sp.]|uniref:hypothetical protein n=1 Tax=Desulfobacca sp. TaxID=2067990 RepID=UPI004049BE84